MKILKMINFFEKEKIKLLERQKGFEREVKDRNERLESFKDKIRKKSRIF